MYTAYASQIIRVQILLILFYCFSWFFSLLNKIVIKGDYYIQFVYFPSERRINQQNEYNSLNLSIELLFKVSIYYSKYSSNDRTFTQGIPYFISRFVKNKNTKKNSNQNSTEYKYVHFTRCLYFERPESKQFCDNVLYLIIILTIDNICIYSRLSILIVMKSHYNC